MAEDVVDLVSSPEDEGECDSTDVIDLVSASDEELDGSDEEEWLSADPGECSGGDVIEVDGDSDGSNSDDDGDNSEEDDVEDEKDSNDDEDPVINRVSGLLKEGGKLDELKVEDCKAYLRKLGLRIGGTKAVFIERIIQHWRIKGGNGENLYPRASFNIDCTGDVCKGDVVLFMQKVYKTRGRLLGKRLVAGRVVKESYGEAKQQHTFIIEVLWSKGAHKLSSLSPLLVKGRNLYRMKTFRQRWENEAERIKVLEEKHNRGAAARKTKKERKARVIAERHKRVTAERKLREAKSAEKMLCEAEAESIDVLDQIAAARKVREAKTPDKILVKDEAARQRKGRGAATRKRNRHGFEARKVGEARSAKKKLNKRSKRTRRTTGV